MRGLDDEIAEQIRQIQNRVDEAVGVASESYSVVSNVKVSNIM